MLHLCKSGKRERGQGVLSRKREIDREREREKKREGVEEGERARYKEQESKEAEPSCEITVGNN